MLSSLKYKSKISRTLFKYNFKGADNITFILQRLHEKKLSVEITVTTKCC